ncbi:MAG: hypothetical protein V7744_08930 [Pseudomonadales bacterium]
MDESINKLDIAQEFLEVACEEYNNYGRYFAVSHLAGAAEEIYGHYLESQSLSPEDEPVSAEQQARADGNLILREVFDDKRTRSVGELNEQIRWSKNSIKHITGKNGVLDQFVDLDAKEEAEHRLSLAIDNHMRLDREVTQPIRRYLADQKGQSLLNAHVRFESQ